jgi:hypothetical protein
VAAFGSQSAYACFALCQDIRAHALQSDALTFGEHEMHVSVVRPFVVFAVGFALVGAALTPLRAEAPAEPAPQSAAAGPLIQLAQDARSPWERCSSPVYRSSAQHLPHRISWLENSRMLMSQILQFLLNTAASAINQ